MENIKYSLGNRSTNNFFKLREGLDNQHCTKKDQEVFVLIKNIS